MMEPHEPTKEGPIVPVLARRPLRYPDPRATALSDAGLSKGPRGLGLRQSWWHVVRLRLDERVGRGSASPSPSPRSGVRVGRSGEEFSSFEGVVLRRLREGHRIETVKDHPTVRAYGTSVGGWASTRQR